MKKELTSLVGSRSANRIMKAYPDAGNFLTALRERTFPADDKAMMTLANAFTALEAVMLAGVLGKRELLNTPDAVRDFLRVHMAGRSQEIFTVLFLDNQNRLISADDMFFGSLAQTAVYPRAVVRKAMAYNSAAVVLAHNHPSSGLAEPSNADKLLTDSLKSALAHLEVRVLDHLIVGDTITSFAERGLL
ncbi:MAG: JAB domain-containing protein [Burkholderiaceae bacterium]